MRDAERVNKCMLLAAREQFRKKCAAGQQVMCCFLTMVNDFKIVTKNEDLV